MDKVIALVIVVALCLATGLFLAYLVSNSEANRLEAQAGLEYARGQARALVIEAQGQASLDRAQAYAMTLNSGLPWGVLGILGILGLALVALAFVVVARGQQNRPEVIERVIIERLPEPERRPLPQPKEWELPALIVDDSIFEELER